MSFTEYGVAHYGQPGTAWTMLNLRSTTTRAPEFEPVRFGPCHVLYRVLLSVVLPSGTGRLSDLDSLIGGYAFPWYLPRVPEWGSMAVCSITEYRVEFRQCYFMIRDIAIVSMASIARLLLLLYSGRILS